MSVIENFAELSAQEQRAFAEALIKTINTEHLFTSEVDFKITEIEAVGITGSLEITAEHDGTIEIRRKATWQAIDSEDAEIDPGYDADYEQSIYTDTERAFKTLSTTIDGYTVSLTVDDVDDDEAGSVEIDNISNEDSGIGSYEYWGDTGYDSNEYVEVKGTIIKDVKCFLTFWVEPADEPIAAEPEETEED